MVTRLETYDDVVPEMLKDSQILSAFFKFLRNYDKRDAHGNPFYRSGNYYLIYWPSLLAYPRRLKSFAEKVGFSTNIPETGPPFNAYIRGFKEHFERLLGPLCLPPPEHVLQAYTTEQHRPGLAPVIALAGFDNEQNYTCFLRLVSDLGACVRTRLRPPIFDTTAASFLEELPESLHALYFAWRTLRSRHMNDDPNANDFFFSFEEVGVTYLDNGWLFIDWDTFMRCPFSPKILRGKVTAAELYSQLWMLKSPYVLKRALIERPDADVRRGLHDLGPEYVPYQKLARYHKAVVDAGLPLNKETVEGFYTIVDPYVLHTKDRLFDGRRVHLRRKKRKQALLAYKHRVKTGDTSKARVYKPDKVQLRARGWLRNESDAVFEKIQKVQWFPDDVNEPLYYVKHMHVFYFMRPEYPATHKNENERAVFERALNALKMVVKHTETGKLDFEPESKREFYARVNEGLRDEARAAFLADFYRRVGLNAGETPEMSQREANKRIASYVEKHFNTNPEGQSSFIRQGNWYNKAIAYLSLKYISPHTVYLKRLTRLPDEDGSQVRTFFSPSAISVFHDFTKASLGLLKTLDPEEGLLGEIIHGRPEASITRTPAPYLYAWTQCCRYLIADFRKQPWTYERHQNPNTWIPEEDLYLLQNYTTKPRLADYASQKRERYPGGPLGSSWEEILYTLINRSEQSCKTHIAYVNQLLRRLLTEKQYEIYRYGGRACTEAEARRVVLFIGCMRFYPKTGLSPRLPFVKYVLNIPEKELLEMPIPTAYRKGYYVTFTGLTM